MPLMCNNVIDIKYDTFGQVWLLKNFFFFEYLYFSEYDIRMLLFVFWLRSRSSIKYVRNTGIIQGIMFTGAYRGKGVGKSVIWYVGTK